MPIPAGPPDDDVSAGWDTPTALARRAELPPFPAEHRSREWTAVAASELEVVREMASCLRLIGAGEIPT